MGLLSPALANNWKRAILLGLGLLACAEAPPVERPPTVLGRAGVGWWPDHWGTLTSLEWRGTGLGTDVLMESDVQRAD